MIHTVETAGTVDPSSAGSVCIVELSSLFVDILLLGTFFFLLSGFGLGGRLETIEESEFDRGKCACYWLLKAIANIRKGELLDSCRFSRRLSET